MKSQALNDGIVTSTCLFSYSTGRLYDQRLFDLWQGRLFDFLPHAFILLLWPPQFLKARRVSASTLYCSPIELGSIRDISFGFSS